MPKTIALASFSQKLADELTARGYRVIDRETSSRPGALADAYLYTSYRPDMNDDMTGHPGHADISVGNYHYITSDHPDTIKLNITGLKASQISDNLELHLARRPRL